MQTYFNLQLFIVSLCFSFVYSSNAQVLDWNLIDFSNSQLIEGKINGLNMGGYSYGRMNVQSDVITVESECKQCATNQLLCGAAVNDVSGSGFSATENKANMVSQTAKLKPGVLRFPGGTHSGWYHLYTYDNQGFYDAADPVIDKGFGMSLIETAHLNNPLSYCVLDSRLITSENYIDGFINYIRNTQNEMDGDQKIEVTYVANLLTHFRFPSNQVLCTGCGRTKAVIPMDNYDCTTEFNLSYEGNEALFNNDENIYRFELYYKETQDAINRMVSQLNLGPLDRIYVEMGNEYYSTGGYPESKYQITVDDYAKLVEVYSERLKCFFKDKVEVQVGVVTKPNTAWQTGLIDRLGDDQSNNGENLDEIVDAVIFHQYYTSSTCLNESNIESRFACAKETFRDFIENDFNSELQNLQTNFSNQNVWITEWNILLGDQQKNNSYLNTILHASFIQEYALGMLEYNANNPQKVSMATHHRIGDHNIWSVVQSQEGNNDAAYYRAGGHAMELLSKLYDAKEMRWVGNIFKDGTTTFDTKDAKSTMIFQPGNGIDVNGRLLLYFTNKSNAEIPFTVPAIIDGEDISEAKISYLRGDHLFTYGPANATAGRNRFKVSDNNISYNADLDQLGFGALHDQFVSTADTPLNIETQQVLPANSIGVVEIVLDDIVKIDNPTAQNLKLSIYPSPASGQVNVEFLSRQQQEIELSLLTIDGRKIYYSKEKIEAGNNVLKLNVDQFPSGIYFLSVQLGANNLRDKLMIYR